MTARAQRCVRPTRFTDIDARGWRKSVVLTVIRRSAVMTSTPLRDHFRGARCELPARKCADREEIHPMLTFVRAGIAAALVILLPALAAGPAAAEKAFQRDDLADAAIKLEAKIKSDAGQVAKPAATLRRDADAAFGRNDFRTGLQILGQIVVAAPNDSTNWLRLAKSVLQIRPSNDQERSALLDRAATAAYIAYQRTSNSAEEAESLLVIAR